MNSTSTNDTSWVEGSASGPQPARPREHNPWIEAEPASRRRRLRRRPSFADVAIVAAVLVYAMTLTNDASGLNVLSLDEVEDGQMVHRVGPMAVSGRTNYDDSWNAVLGYDMSAHPELAYGGQQFDGMWDGGNVEPTDSLGKGLVIAGRVPAKILEARKNPGSMYFDFDEPATRFGLTIIDVEGDEQDTADGYFLSFSYMGEVIDTIAYAEFTTPGADYYDETIEFGHNTANRIAAIEASSLGDGSYTFFDRVEVAPGGSQVVAEVTYAVPTPTALAAGLSMLALAVMRRTRG